MKVLSVVLLVSLAGCMALENGEEIPTAPGEDPQDAEGRPVLASFGVDIAPYDPATGQAGDILFSDDLMYDDGRIHNDRPFVDFGWTHEYYPQANIEYWFYVPLHTSLAAPASGQVSIDYLDHTDDYALHIESVPGWTVSFEHVVDIRVDDGQWVEAGDIIADAAPRPGFGEDLAMVELAVWQGGTEIVKHCPADFLAPELQDAAAARLDRLAADWEDFVGQDVYDEDAWVSPGCLVHEIQEA